MLVIVTPFVAAQPLIDPESSGFNGETRSENYNTLMDALFANDKVTTTIGDKLWVPWFSRSNSCELNDLQSGDSCNSGSEINFTNNCMVTDEFSQVGVLVSMDDDQPRMDQYFNTVKDIASTNGEIPAWRVYRNGDAIESCRAGINGNCDTASDATARIIVSLYTASENPRFDDSARAEYEEHANTLSQDFLEYEVEHTCRPTDWGETCNWLASGSEAKRGGIGSYNFAYSGYYADSIKAMLAACSQTGNDTYCRAADDFTRNYLQASKFDGSTFSVSPGRSFTWVIDSQGQPQAECTGGCDPVMWDGADAPRAFSMCGANYYAKAMDHSLPGLDEYCTVWHDTHAEDPESIPLQYEPDGTPGDSQSGLFAQGLQSLLLMDGPQQSTLSTTLDSALSHYVPSTGTWDYQACFGVYHQAFPVRALGSAIGLDLDVFTSSSNTEPEPEPEPDPVEPGSTLETFEATCVDATKTKDVFDGCRQVTCEEGNNDISVLACEKGEGEDTFFEMYRQEYTGEGIAVCIGETCLEPGYGFVSSPPYTNDPVEPEPEPEPEPVPDPVPPPSDPVDPVCPSLQDIPATCEGTITSDSYNGCRQVACEKDGISTTVKACSKPDGDSPEYIEMYRQSGSELEVCLGTLCLKPGFGFVSSDDMCLSGDAEEPVEPVPIPPPVIDESVTLGIAPWYPKGRDYIFECHAEGASTYDWYFGDGTEQLGTTRDDVYHSYQAAGTYEVSCVAHDDAMIGSDERTVSMQ